MPETQTEKELRDDRPLKVVPDRKPEFPCTRAEAAKFLGVSATTVGARVKALMQFHKHWELLDVTDRIAERGYDRVREYGELGSKGYARQHGTPQMVCPRQMPTDIPLPAFMFGDRVCWDAVSSKSLAFVGTGTVVEMGYYGFDFTHGDVATIGGVDAKWRYGVVLDRNHPTVNNFMPQKDLRKVLTVKIFALQS